jgi:prophage antirepressor-like protein
MKTETDLFLEEQTEKKLDWITQNEFEQLSKAEQNFRWALFLKSNGYEKNLSEQMIEQLRQRHLVNKEPLPKAYFEGR